MKLSQLPLTYTGHCQILNKASYNYYQIKPNRQHGRKMKTLVCIFVSMPSALILFVFKESKHLMCSQQLRHNKNHQHLMCTQQLGHNKNHPMRYLKRRMPKTYNSEIIICFFLLHLHCLLMVCRMK